MDHTTAGQTPGSGAPELGKRPAGNDLEELKRELRKLGGQLYVSDDLPEELQRHFLERLLAYEKAERTTTLRAILAQGGMTVTPPDELADGEITDRLWELIHALALLDVYLLHTDHLSDAELYGELWEELHEPMVADPEPGSRFYIDCVGGGTDEDLQIYLRYYADETGRRVWAEDWPEDPMPAPEKPPFDRDRKLPAP